MSWPVASMSALLLAAVLTPICRAAGHTLRVLDVPNERSSHVRPTPRTGGVAIIASFLIVAAAAMAPDGFDLRSTSIVMGVALISVLGLLDDFTPLSASTRLVVQVMCAAGVIAAGALHLDVLRAGETSVRLGYLGMVAALVWIVGLTNGFNFMDGINGIAAVQALIGGLALAAMLGSQGDPAGAVIAAALAGAAAGFLPWNLPSGSVFMGDSGSAALGFGFAALALRCEQTGGTFLAAALVFTPFLSDTLVTLVRRFRAGERLLTAHRSHFYQRLVRSGWSHTATTFLWGGLAVTSAVGALVAVRGDAVTLLAAAAGLALVHAAVFAAITRAESRRA